MKLQNIFWTSGLDSTCRVYLLSKLDNVMILPYYLITRHRKTIQTEIDNALKMRDLIGSDKIRTTIVNDTSRMHYYMSLLHDFAVVTRHYMLGSQYHVISLFLYKNNLKCEISIHSNDLSFRLKLFEHIVMEENEYDYYPVRPCDDSELSVSMFNIFLNYLFPKTIFNMTKQLEFDLLKKERPDLLKYISFCHRTRNSVPCGNCYPCRCYKEEGLFDFFELLHKNDNTEETE